MSDKSILFITNQLPYPLSTGGKMKSWNLINFLCKEYKTGLVTLLKNDEKKDESEMLQKLELKDYYSEQLDIPRTAINLLRSYFSAGTLNILRNRSKSLVTKVSELSKEYDLVIVDHYEMYPSIEHIKGTPIILHEHNAEFKIWDRMSEIESNPIKKIVLKIEANRIKKAEKKFAVDADLVWAAPNDIKALKNLGIDSKKFAVTFHLGDDKFIDYPDVSFDQTKKQVIFVGTQTWEANIDGMEWFLGEVWPIVLGGDKNTQLVIIGKNPSARLTKFLEDSSNITFTGYVDDLEDYYSTARLSIVPLRFGSGMKVKLLNSMFRGIPNVTTSVGAEGIDLKNGREIYISDDANEFADYVLHLLNDQKIWEQFRDKSRKLVRDKYSWKILLSKHKKEIDLLLEK